MRAASGGIATREVKLKQEHAQVKAILRAIFETMDFNRREKPWMVSYIQNRWRLTASVAEEAYRYWLQGLTSDGKISTQRFAGDLRSSLRISAHSDAGQR
jgi:hypothetical protein